MSRAPQLGLSGKIAVSLSLTGVGGFVDAVGYLALFQIFTANMSGNSVHIGMDLGRQRWSEVWRPLCAVASYVLAMALTRIAIEVAGRRKVRRIASFTLAMEAVLLACFAHATPAMHLGQIVDLHSPGYFTLIALLALAMGIQTATLTHVGALTIYTTFVTGTLTKLTESFTRVLFWGYDQLRKSPLPDILRAVPQQRDLREATMLVFAWIAYVVGAALGVVVKQRWDLRALYLPAAVLIGFIVVDQVHPIGVEEERHQTRSG